MIYRYVYIFRIDYCINTYLIIKYIVHTLYFRHVHTQIIKNDEQILKTSQGFVVV